MLQTLDIRLRRSTRVFKSVVRDMLLSVNDKCIVRGDRGLEYGTCITTPEDCSEENAKRHPMSVVRKATYKDDTAYSQLAESEAAARDLCAEKIAARNLPMELVDVEYTFDKRKVVFSFTAEDRVDFRDLVRDLARELRTRIELRHIQIRDQAKVVGGLAACGRELCCSLWMTEFAPISMKMAKRQSLSLNPSKISGQCGRLMCCLAYENDQYQAKKKKPRQPPPCAAGEKTAPCAAGKKTPPCAAVPLPEEEPVSEKKAAEQPVAADAPEAGVVPEPEPVTPPAASEAEQAPAPAAETKGEAAAEAEAEAKAPESGKKKRPRRRRRHRRPRGKSSGGGPSAKS